MRILFLYSEVMGYTLSLINALTEEFHTEVRLVHWDEKKLTPFHFTSKKIRSYKRSSFHLSQIVGLIEEWKPDIVYTSGWMDKAYLKAARYAKKKGIKVVAGMDTPWQGTFKQRISSAMLKYFWKKHFDYIWVPGKRQRDYAIKLGYKKHVLENLYTADVALYQEAWKKSRKKKQIHYPKKLLFVGRLAEEKGISLLIDVFKETKRELQHDWQLLVAGAGPLQTKFSSSKSVIVLGFQSSEKLVDIMANSGVFCLPSTWEPWGLVIHESACAGLPLILSDACGAAERFLHDEENGFLLRSGDRNDLKETLLRLFTLSDENLFKMGEKSFKLSGQITPEISAQSLISVMNGSRY